MRDSVALTRRAVAAALPFAAFAAAPVTALSSPTPLDGHASADLSALGKAWTVNLEQQRLAIADTHAATTPAAYADADQRWDRLLEDESKLSRAIRALPASTADELALKGRVVLREIGLTLTGRQVLDPDGWDSLDVGQAIAASLALDLIRLAGGTVGTKGGIDA